MAKPRKVSTGCGVAAPIVIFHPLTPLMPSSESAQGCPEASRAFLGVEQLSAEVVTQPQCVRQAWCVHMAGQGTVCGTRTLESKAIF